MMDSETKSSEEPKSSEEKPEVKLNPQREKIRLLLENKHKNKASILEKHLYNASIKLANVQNITTMNDPRFWYLYLQNAYEIVDSELSQQEIIKKCQLLQFGWKNSVFQEVIYRKELEENFIYNQGNDEIAEGAVECPSCHGKRVLSKTAQIRSADEGETVFYKCINKNCGRSWKIYN